MTKTVIDGVEVKVGDTIAYTQWLTFECVVVDIPKKNVLKIATSMQNPMFPDTLSKGYKHWKLNGSIIKVDLKPDHEKVEAHNDAIRNSERWMCM